MSWVEKLGKCVFMGESAFFSGKTWENAQKIEDFRRRFLRRIASPEVLNGYFGRNNPAGEEGRMGDRFR